MDFCTNDNDNDNQNYKKRPYHYLHHQQFERFTDSVIGNGVIVSTSFGSGGYYSYIDRVVNDIDISTKRESQLFDDDMLGVCHILPIFASRRMKRDHTNYDSNYNDCEKFVSCPIRYTVPFRSTIKITLLREANALLYGTTEGSEGVTITVNTPITITPSNRIARIIRL